IGKYETYEDAMSLLDTELRAIGVERAAGMHPLEACCRHFLGEPVAPLAARTYDVLLGDWGAGLSLGVCEGHRIVGLSDDGLVRFPLKFAKVAFNVEGR